MTCGITRLKNQIKRDKVAVKKKLRLWEKIMGYDQKKIVKLKARDEELEDLLRKLEKL
ncbi:MAG: hypothetical protein GY845_09145 [Planctomycetes bacterium]|nr:hypothetical protein [Planctomycetota bacterium]